MVVLHDLGHRCFLPGENKFTRINGPFNGRKEHKEAPSVLSGRKVYNQMKCLVVTIGKNSKAPCQVGRY